MADFRTHISFSTILGFGYGAAGHWYFGLPPDTSMLGACLCSVAGMLPDLDSASGRPIRESLAFGAAVVPMLLIDRFQQLSVPPATMVLAGALVYLLIRFGLGWFLKNYTVHRGMFHSIPALAIVAIVGYLITGCAALDVRYFHAGALALGYLSHLVLDEIYSVDLRHVRIKSSFGTALKFWGPSLWGNFSVYAKLALLSVVAFGDPIYMEQFQQGAEKTAETTTERIEHTAREMVDRIWR
jgi:membrane-bound metal-dependent hydrolase YbcI (DUF457 family)